MPFQALIPAVVTVAAALVVGLWPRRWSGAERRHWENGLVGIGAVVLLAVKLDDGARSAGSLGAVLPLQVCDISSIACLVALRGGPRLASALVLYFGLDLSSLALAFPDLGAGPGSLEYWLFWLRHGVILASAVYVLAVRGFRPTWPDFWHWCAFGVAYVVIVAVVNRMLGTNYAFIGDRVLEHTHAVDAFGPWPGRALVMLLLAVVQGAAVTWITVLGSSGADRLTSTSSIR